MKLNSVTKLEKSIVELEIEVEAEVFQKAVDAAFAKNASKINIPGVRKGKAPRKIIEKMLGEGVFYEEAVNATYPEAYDEAVAEAGLDTVGRGEVEIEKVDAAGYTFKAKIPVRPEVKLGEYVGIKAQKPSSKISDEELDAEMERIRRSHGRLVSVEDRAVEDGDTVVIDFEGFVDGVAFEGGKAEKHSLTIGSGQFIPGFEEQLIGKSIGEDVEVNVSFPEDYHEKSLAGKPAVFKVKIFEIKFNELPELNDEIAKDVSEFDTLEDYKKSIKKGMEERAQARAERAAEEAVITKVIEGMEADVPDAMIENQINSIVQEYDGNLRQQGLNLETYLQFTGSDMEKFRSTFRETAEKTVKSRLALEEIVKAEKIVVDEEEIEAEYKRMSEQYEVDLEQIKNFIPSERLAEDIAVDKALKYVMANAKITTKRATKA